MTPNLIQTSVTVHLKSTDLIGQAVQRARKAVHGSAEGQIGVGQGTAHQVAGVGTDVASFVVTVRAGKRNSLKTFQDPSS